MADLNDLVPINVHVIDYSPLWWKIFAIIIVYGQLALEIFLVGLLLHLGWSLV